MAEVLNVETGCRLCGSATLVFNIFDTSNGLDNLQDKVLAVTGVEISNNGKYSKNLCHNCSYWIKRMYNFRFECQKFDERFHAEIIRKEKLEKEAAARAVKTPEILTQPFQVSGDEIRKGHNSPVMSSPSTSQVTNLRDSMCCTSSVSDIGTDISEDDIYVSSYDPQSANNYKKHNWKRLYPNITLYSGDARVPMDCHVLVERVENLFKQSLKQSSTLSRTPFKSSSTQVWSSQHALTKPTAEASTTHKQGQGHMNGGVVGENERTKCHYKRLLNPPRHTISDTARRVLDLASNSEQQSNSLQCQDTQPEYICIEIESDSDLEDDHPADTMLASESTAAADTAAADTAAAVDIATAADIPVVADTAAAAVVNVITNTDSGDIISGDSSAQLWLGSDLDAPNKCCVCSRYFESEDILKRHEFNCHIIEKPFRIMLDPLKIPRKFRGFGITCIKYIESNNSLRVQYKRNRKCIQLPEWCKSNTPASDSIPVETDVVNCDDDVFCINDELSVVERDCVVNTFASNSNSTDAVASVASSANNCVNDLKRKISDSGVTSEKKRRYTIDSLTSTNIDPLLPGDNSNNISLVTNQQSIPICEDTPMTERIMHNYQAWKKQVSLNNCNAVGHSQQVTQEATTSNLPHNNDPHLQILKHNIVDINNIWTKICSGVLYKSDTVSQCVMGAVTYYLRDKFGYSGAFLSIESLVAERDLPIVYDTKSPCGLDFVYRPPKSEVTGPFLPPVNWHEVTVLKQPKVLDQPEADGDQTAVSDVDTLQTLVPKLDWDECERSELLVDTQTNAEIRTLSADVDTTIPVISKVQTAPSNRSTSKLSHVTLKSEGTRIAASKDNQNKNPKTVLNTLLEQYLHSLVKQVKILPKPPNFTSSTSPCLGEHQTKYFVRPPRKKYLGKVLLTHRKPDAVIKHRNYLKTSRAPKKISSTPVPSAIASPQTPNHCSKIMIERRVSIGTYLNQYNPDDDECDIANSTEVVEKVQTSSVVDQLNGVTPSQSTKNCTQSTNSQMKNDVIVILDDDEETCKKMIHLPNNCIPLKTGNCDARVSTQAVPIVRKLTILSPNKINARLPVVTH